MNKDEKKQIINLLGTVKEAVHGAKLNINNSDYLIKDSSEALRAIESFLSEREPNYDSKNMLECSERMSRYNKLAIKDKKSSLTYFEKTVDQLIKSINDIKRKEKIKAVFLPYKLSMWTSLESVWKAADEDEDCEAVVVPIPYHEMDSERNMAKICYEGENYPDYVPVTKFWEYDIAKEKPDMIFIHNPYDDTNILTRVPEEYYSRNLKKYTSNLVYIPYFTQFLYNLSLKSRLFGVDLEAINHVDKIIVENDDIKKKYEENKSSIGKVLALGSPKFDAIYDIRENGLDCIGKWEGIVKEKKVFLLVTTLSLYSRNTKNAFEIIVKIISELSEKQDCILIWRPHPLEERWIRNSMPQLNEVYENIKYMFNKFTNMYIDLEDEYKTILYIADGVFSSSSSLVNEIMAMGRPLYMMEGNKVYQSGAKHLIDHRYNYYHNETDISEFIENVVNKKEDNIYSKRIEVFNNSIKNARYGDSGKKIYESIKKNLQ